MRASKLIKELNRIVKVHGDLYVVDIDGVQINKTTLIDDGSKDVKEYPGSIPVKILLT